MFKNNLMNKSKNKIMKNKIHEVKFSVYVSEKYHEEIMKIIRSIFNYEKIDDLINITIIVNKHNDTRKTTIRFYSLNKEIFHYLYIKTHKNDCDIEDRRILYFTGKVGDKLLIINSINEYVFDLMNIHYNLHKFDHNNEYYKYPSYTSF